MKTKAQKNQEHEKTFTDRGLYRMMIRVPKDKKLREKIRKRVAKMVKRYEKR